MGFIASLRRTAMAPATLISSAVTGFPSFVMARTIRPSRLRKSRSPLVRASMAITSLATVISNPESRSNPSCGPPRPILIFRRNLSETSITRRHFIVAGSIFSGFPFKTELSKNAAQRLCANPTAWTSPVRCKLKSSIGTTCEYPPPAAPPLMPNTGPKDGWRIQTAVFLPIRLSDIARPIVVTVFPSPSGVGVIAVTSIYLPSLLCLWRSRTDNDTFAMCSP